MVPKGWREQSLEEICKQKIVYGIVQAGEHDPDGVPYIKSSDVGGIIPVDRLQRTNPEIHMKYERSKVVPGDIVFSLRGNTGATSIVPEGLTEANLTQGTARLAVSGAHDTAFVRFMLASNLAMRQVLAVAKGSTFTEVSLDALRKVRLPLPPLAEQKRVAEVLGVWDRAIEVAGKQLDLARTQKRALMQTLLTPTRRFPGYEGQPWNEVRLGDVGVISSAGVDKKTNPSEPEVRLLNFLDVFRRDFLFNKEFDHVVTAPTTKLEQCNVLKGDVFFTPSSETRDDLARSAVAMEDMPGVVYSYHVVRFRLTGDWDMNFRAFVFQSDRFQRQAYEKGDGSGQRYVISQSNFRDMTVFVPGRAEQALIGATLKAAADEIITLETQITRLQAEKKALMQQLLTGKKRLAV